MIRDADALFADKVSVAAAAGTTLIGSEIDLTQLTNNMVSTPELYLVLTVDTAIITGGSAGTLQFALATDATAAISTTTSIRHLLTPAYVTGASGLEAGTVLFICRLPHGLIGTTANPLKYKRFLGILAIVGTTTITAGKINAFLTTEVGQWTALPQGTVS